MPIRDWALITFTILAQMSVGSFIVLGVAHLFAQRKATMEQADKFSDRVLLAIVPALALGMLASFFHLGSPLSAYLAVARVGASWLSREILFGVLFGAVGAVFVLMQWRKISTFPVRRLVALIACVLGLALVWSMSMVYMVPAMPAWNTIATPLAFFTTTFLLGALAVGAALVANYAYLQRKDPGCADAQCELVRAALRWIALASIVLLGIEFLVLPVQLGTLATVRAGLGGTGLEIFAGAYGSVLLFRVALVFIGVAILGVFLYQNASSPGRERVMGNLTYAAFVLVLIAEVMGRFLFYATNPGL